MADDTLEVGFAVYVETVPKVSANHNASESQIAEGRDIVQRHATEGIDMLVN